MEFQHQYFSNYCYITNDGCYGVNCYYKQLKRLQAENELLKRLLNEKVKTLDKMTGIYSARLCKKYKQALEEIREDLEQDTTCESRECGCDDYEECLKCVKETILDKIKEVLK